MSASLYLGAQRPLDNSRASSVLRVPAHHLVTHGVVVGMTGSGKTGLITVLVEEALRTGVPVLMVDVKGALLNRLLPFADFAGATVQPWVEVGPHDTRSLEQVAAAVAAEREA